MNDTDDNSKTVGMQERFVFRHTMRFGNDVEYDGRAIDVTTVDSPEAMLDRVLYGFLAFLEDQDFDSKQIFDRALNILLEARIRQENPLTFGEKIGVAPNKQFEAFLKRIRAADVDMLKELYNIYTGKFSLN